MNKSIKIIGLQSSEFYFREDEVIKTEFNKISANVLYANLCSFVVSMCYRFCHCSHSSKSVFHSVKTQLSRKQRTVWNIQCCSFNI